MTTGRNSWSANYLPLQCNNDQACLRQGLAHRLQCWSLHARWLAFVNKQTDQARGGLRCKPIGETPPAFRIFRGTSGLWEVVEDGIGGALALFKAPQAALS